MLFIYCDGGPDHRLTYVSVQLSLISLFLQLDLDFLCACCTAPCHSWRNPVERIMSIINLGMQCVGLMIKEVGKEWEGLLTKCNSLTQLRQAAKKTPALGRIKLITCLSSPPSPIFGPRQKNYLFSAHARGVL